MQDEWDCVHYVHCNSMYEWVRAVCVWDKHTASCSGQKNILTSFAGLSSSFIPSVSPFHYSRSQTNKTKFTLKWEEQERGEDADEQTEKPENVSPWAQPTPVGYT